MGSPRLDNQFDTESLYSAIQTHNMGEVQRLIEKKVDVNHQFSRGLETTPLSLAVSAPYTSSLDSRLLTTGEKKNNDSIIQMLLDAKANVNITHDWRPGGMLAMAARHNFATFKVLWSHFDRTSIKTPIEETDNPWYFPVMVSAWENDKLDETIKIFDLLKEGGLDFQAQKHTLNSWLRSLPFKLPTRDEIDQYKKSREEFRRQLSSWKDVELDMEREEKDIQKMIICANTNFKEKLERLKFLFENGADPNFIEDDDEERNSFLHVVIKKCYLGHIKNGFQQIINMCLQYDFYINTINAKEETLLHSVAKEESVSERRRLEIIEITKVLLATRININAITPKGWSALHYAAKYNPELVALLMKAGAHYFPDRQGKKPRYYLRQTKGIVGPLTVLDPYSRPESSWEIGKKRLEEEVKAAERRGEEEVELKREAEKEAELKMEMEEKRQAEEEVALECISAGGVKFLLRVTSKRLVSSGVGLEKLGSIENIEKEQHFVKKADGRWTAFSLGFFLPRGKNLKPPLATSQFSGMSTSTKAIDFFGEKTRNKYYARLRAINAYNKEFKKPGM